MNYKPNPLLYGATEDFLSSFRIAITMCSEVDYGILRHAVDGAMARYPYFCVYPEKQENSLRLCHNPHPVPVFDDGRSAVLGSEELHGHLLAFGCEGRQIFLHASHYIADGMGIDPLLKTVLYLYASERYGTEGLQAERIQMPTDPVLEAEYAYPFPDAPFEIDDTYLPRRAPDIAFELDSDAFDDNGFYAYHLHVPQRALMEKANPSDGSPVSFLSVMLYRALCQLNEKINHPVVVHVQHQYRALLNAPTNRHSLVSYVPVTLPAKMKDWQVMQQNTVVRGQILLGSETAADMSAINRLLCAMPDEHASLVQKKLAMKQYIEGSICAKTFGISYVGKIDWCGLDHYVEDIHAYIGEKHTKSMLLIEVMTIGEDFTLNFMQSGRGDRYVNAFVDQLRLRDIPVKIVGEGRYTLCDTKIPD